MSQACPARRAVLPDLPDAHAAWVEATQEEEGGEGEVILAIDPGPVHSAYVLLKPDLSLQEFGKLPNDEILSVISGTLFYIKPTPAVAIEMCACYGMAVGKEVFETCVWIGRFTQMAGNVEYIYRKDEKMNLCGSMRAKDSNIRQALIDRFGVVGTKARKGWFYGVSKDVWAAVAVGVTYHDLYIKGVTP